jgi:hypothetical protein
LYFAKSADSTATSKTIERSEKLMNRSTHRFHSPVVSTVVVVWRRLFFSMEQREDGNNGSGSSTESGHDNVGGEDVIKGVVNLAINEEKNEESLEPVPESSTGPVRDDLYDEPEDLNTQTVIQNRYCFWCHRRGGKTSVCHNFKLFMSSPLPLLRIIMKRV